MDNFVGNHSYFQQPRGFKLWKTFFCLFAFFACDPVFSQDPFDRTQRKNAENRAQLIIEQTVDNQTCKIDAMHFAEKTAWKNLTIIGVLEYQHLPNKVFLVDENQQIIAAKQGDVIAKEQYQIQQISPSKLMLREFLQGKCDQFRDIEQRF